MPSQSNRRKTGGQGGGRVANSEPRVQVFKDFSGCNFQLSPRDFTLGREFLRDFSTGGDRTEEQSDLQMNFVTVQNNAIVTANKTIETRDNIKTICSAGSNEFTGPCILIDKTLHMAMSDDSIRSYRPMEDDDWDWPSEKASITDNSGKSKGSTWTDFAYADNKLIALTEQNQIWTAPINSDWQLKVSNAKKVPDPTAKATVTPKKKLKTKSSLDDDHPYRVSVAYSYINQYGPTNLSPIETVYTNYTVENWHSGRYMQVGGSIPTGYGIKAVEIYYNVDNASTMLLAGRVDIASDATTWKFNWYGYLDATSMWPVANLVSPDDNYTEGVHASHVACIDSRLYFWGNKSKPYRLWIGGNSGNLLSTARGTAGGFVDVEPGTGQEIRVVDKFKTQSGNSIVTMLCDSKNSSHEQRFNLVENTITVSNEQNMKSWQAEQVAGAVGCKSYRGAVVCADGMYSVSRYGIALITLTMEYNSQIRATYTSDPIKPVFMDKHGQVLKNSCLLECDGILYVAFGKDDTNLDNIIFCYDIDGKAWWTVTLDTDESILNMFHCDYEGRREGVGIVTPKHVYLLPTTIPDPHDNGAMFETLIKTGELSTTQPQQGWQYLSQLEFHFDYFIGDLTIELDGIDQFGRHVSVKKVISHKSIEHNLTEWMRVDLRLQSYQLTIKGKARFRMTHFMAKVYTMSTKQGLVWGFDDSKSFRSFGDIYPTFKDYNDIRQAVIP